MKDYIEQPIKQKTKDEFSALIYEIMMKIQANGDYLYVDDPQVLYFLQSYREECRNEARIAARHKIKSDLLNIAHQGEYEELRREVEAYFKAQDTT